MRERITGESFGDLLRRRGPIAAVALFTVLCLIVSGPLLATETAQYGGTYADWPGQGANSALSWTAVNNLNDAITALSIDGRNDFVGDATDPCFYYAKTSSFIYFRVRVHANTSSFTNGAILIMIKGSGNYPTHAFTWDNKSNKASLHGLEMQAYSANTATYWQDVQFYDVDGDPSAKTTVDFYRAGDGYIRTVDGQGTANFGTTTFIDFAISHDYLVNYSTTGLDFTSQAWTIQLASIENATDHNDINADIAGGSERSTALSSGWPTGSTLAFLGRFGSCYRDGRMLVAWETLAEIDNAGFHLWRSDDAADGFRRITPALIESQGGPLQTTEYSFEDADVQDGRVYFYKLESVDTSGFSDFHGPITALASTILPTSPADGLGVVAASVPRFGWDGGAFAAFRVELSANPDFEGTIVAIPSSARASWIAGDSLMPSARDWSRVRVLAGAPGIVYWRVRGIDTAGAEGVSVSRWLRLR